MLRCQWLINWMKTWNVVVVVGDHVIYCHFLYFLPIFLYFLRHEANNTDMEQEIRPAIWRISLEAQRSKRRCIGDERLNSVVTSVNVTLRVHCVLVTCVSFVCVLLCVFHMPYSNHDDSVYSYNSLIGPTWLANCHGGKNNITHRLSGHPINHGPVTVVRDYNITPE